MNRTVRIIITIITAGAVSLATNSAFAKELKPLTDDAVTIINNKMDDFHHAADVGDKVRYLNHFAKDGVFMGTDDWERWPYDEFSQYVNTHFKDGKGWSYTPIKRHTTVNDQALFAWVDEIVESKKWGRFRGTAVLEKTDQGWKLKHYSLSVLVPNESWEAVSDITKQAFSERRVDAGVEPPASE